MRHEQDTTFLLLAGTWCGGWCWRFVSDRLIAKGYRVEAPSFAGIAENSHLLKYNISLDDHINDIVNLIKFGDLRRIIIVGHSYAGFPITGAIDRMPPNTVEQVVFIDGLLPNDGEYGVGMMTDEEQESFFQGTVHENRVGIPVPALHQGKMPEDLRQWFQSHMTEHPMRTFQDRIFLKKDPCAGVRASLIACSKLRMPTLLNCRQRAIDRGYKIIPIDSSHNAQVQHSDDVARILVDLDRNK